MSPSNFTSVGSDSTHLGVIEDFVANEEIFLNGFFNVLSQVNGRIYNCHNYNDWLADKQFTIVRFTFVRFTIVIYTIVRFTIVRFTIVRFTIARFTIIRWKINNLQLAGLQIFRLSNWQIFTNVRFTNLYNIHIILRFCSSTIVKLRKQKNLDK